MTHTEESLMALALDIMEGNGEMVSLRRAIREVLAERDMHKDEAEAQRLLRQQQRERAEKAEAECERLKQELVGQAFKFGLAEDGLRKLLSDLWKCECYGWTEELADSITAALKDQP